MTAEEIITSTPLPELVSVCPITLSLYGVVDPVPDPVKIAAKLRARGLECEVHDVFGIVESRIARLRN